MTHDPYRIGVDLGGTKTEAILIGPDTAELLRERIPTDRSRGYESIKAGVTALVDLALARIPAAARATIGIGIPGMWDAANGRVLNANTTELIGRPLKADLVAELGRPVALHNDANCFALAEATAGAGRGHECVVGVIMGTGCGGGLVLGGRLREGPHGIAGEWGHVSIDPQGPECYCGNRGCVETLISGGGVERAFLSLTGRSLTMDRIASSARAGDEQCAMAMSAFLESFGRALGGLVSILDPDIVVLGGGLSKIPELYDEGLACVRRHAFHPALRTPIVKHQLGDSAGVIGAAWAGV